MCYDRDHEEGFEVKVLVTGGAGFIGSHLVDYLIKEGHDVWVFDDLSRGTKDNLNPKAVFFEVDLRDRLKVRYFMDVIKPEVIFHLASHAAEGQSVFVPRFTFEVDLIGFLNLFTEAINVGFETFVFTSSMAVYGNQPELPMREEQPCQPTDPYGVTKAGIERLLQVYNKIFDFNHVVIRPHNVYGPRQSLTNPYRNVMGIWINRIMHDRPPIIYGDGNQTRAFTYIDDCVPYLAKSAWTKEAYGETINIGSEDVHTIKDVCSIVLEKMESSLKPIHRPARPLEVKHAWCSSDKARRILGYKTSTSLEEGIERMTEWAKSVGPQPFHYWSWEDFEIKRKVPDVWRLREL